MNFLISDAWAQAGGDAGGGLFSLLPLVVIFILFYFLLIRPQQKRAKQHKEMVIALKKGEEIVTNGGLLVKVTDLDDNFITLEIASGLNAKVQRQSVAQVMPKGTYYPNAKPHSVVEVADHRSGDRARGILCSSQPVRR